MCLPTGSTPQPMYRRFGEAGGGLTSATVYLLDEFGLPAGAPGRCDAALKRDLLDLVAAPPRATHSWNPQAADLASEVNRFSASVEAGGLDLTVLGIGRNGHLGLNEPGSRPADGARRVELAPSTIAAAAASGSDPQPTWGLTLGMKEILSSARIWLLATGEHKAEILAAALAGDVTSQLPASYLREHPDVTVFCDEAAASRLPGNLREGTSRSDSGFVPPDFAVPDSYTGPGFRLEPLGPEHNARDHEAWMSSVGHIRSTPGFESRDWPAPMSLEQNEKDLEAHARDFADRSGFTYTVLDGEDVIGCVYIYPSDTESDAEVRSWVRASRADMDVVVWRSVSEWIDTSWPFSNVRYAPRDS